MDKAILEQQAKKLFGGATINVQPYQDNVSTAWDVTIVPFIDKEVRFIRVPTTLGINGVLAYLKKIQQNLLQLQKNIVTGIAPIEEPIDEEKVEEEIAKRLPKDATKTIFTCIDCAKKFKYAGPFALHQKKHKKIKNSSVAGALNDSLIYKVNES